MASAPPVGQEQSAVSSVIHDVLDSDCAAECATSSNPEQLAAQLRDLDRSELEQLLLTLLSKAESASE